MSRNDKQNLQVFFGVFALVTGIGAGWVAIQGFSDESVLIPIRHTVQLAFVFYLLVFVARPLQQILRAGWTASLLRSRRLIGIAFAAIMSGHLALIAWRFGAQPELEYPLFNLLFGGTSYALLYLMVITSFDAPKRALGPKKWKVLHKTGIVWAALIFGTPRPPESIVTWDYLKFGIPFAIALIIRITAWQLSRRQGN